MRLYGRILNNNSLQGEIPVQLTNCFSLSNLYVSLAGSFFIFYCQFYMFFLYIHEWFILDFHKPGTSPTITYQGLYLPSETSHGFRLKGMMKVVFFFRIFLYLPDIYSGTAFLGTHFCAVTGWDPYADHMSIMRTIEVRTWALCNTSCWVSIMYHFLLCCKALEFS